jgi:hypothetical protein
MELQWVTKYSGAGGAHGGRDGAGGCPERPVVDELVEE